MRRSLLIALIMVCAVPASAADLEKMHAEADRLVAVNEFRAAVRVYSEIILAEPDDAAAYTDMGRCYMILGDFEHAEDAFKNALHIDPDNEGAAEGLKRIHDPDMDSYFEEKSGKLPDISPGFIQKEIARNTPPAEKPVALLEPFSAKPEPGPRTQKRQRAQRALRNAGYYKGPLDGEFGFEVKAAVQNFQMQHGLIPDGVIGPKTWKVLKEYA